MSNTRFAWLVLTGFACGFWAVAPLAGSEGDPDVVVTDLDSLWVFRGDGNADFEEPAKLFIEACAADCIEAWSVVTGDVDGDGIDDVVSANRFGPHVSVHISNGDGTFASPSILATGDRPYDVDLGDLDADGFLDLVVTCNSGSGPVEVRFNDGEGSFDDVVPLFPGGEPFNSELADFDGDGDLDLAFTKNAGDAMAVLLNGGDGVLSAGPELAVGDDPKAIKSGFFNADEVLDLAITNYAPGEVTVFFGDGEGDFVLSRVYFTGGEPREIVVTDLDLDGFDDLVVADGRGTDRISVFLNRGEGGNGVFDGPHDQVTGPRPNSVDSGDFNSDGFPDVVVANWSLDDPPLATMTLLTGDGEGGFSASRDFVVPGGFRKLTALAVGQFDAPPVDFTRGDANRDASLNITDPVVVLRHLFGGLALGCLDAADADDSGSVQITDAIRILDWLFLQGPPPPPPFPDAGADPTADGLRCRE